MTTNTARFFGLARFAAQIVLFSLALPAGAQTLRLPSVIGDHMVLQAGQPVPIWGWAKPGEAVTVRFAGQEARATAGTDGRWTLNLKPLAATNTPAELQVAADEKLVVSDVIVGEVWLASGQSNMEKPLGIQPGQQPTFGYQEELASANHPDIRMFKVPKLKAGAPAADVKAQWVRCDPASLDAIKFSAAAYYFGRQLHATLKVPVGLIESSWGGTLIEPWTPPAAYLATPSLAQFAKDHAAAPVPRRAMELGMLHNAMIAPLAPFAIKGVLWYQGESNLIDYGDGAIYADKMNALVQSWRALFNKDMAFYYVQIAPHLYHVVRPALTVSPEAEPLLWEAQSAALRIPHTGMVVTTDLVDDLADIHPRNKKEVGERLARLALANDYGRAAIVTSGPTLRAMTVAGGKAILSFDHVGSGLVAADGKPLNWFTIAGADGKFYPASAVIEQDRVVVSSGWVAEPKVVRFAWDEAARPNFKNKDGLPAAPFRSDNPFTRPGPK